MPAAAPVAPTSEADSTHDVDEVPETVWMVDRLPASARVADRVLSTCRAAGCAPLGDRRSSRLVSVRRTGAPRRSSW
jgi:hypothetical protein